MKKIVFLLKSNSFSGAENVVISLMKSLQDRGYDCVYTSPDGPIRNVVESNGLSFYPLKGDGVLAIRKAISDLKPDLIHANDYSMSSLAAFSIRKIPVIAHLHSNCLWARNPFNFKTVFFAISLKKINRVITVSPAVEQEFAYSKTLKSKNYVVPNIIDLEEIISQSNEKSDQELNSYDLAFLGRLSPEKNPEMVFEIVSELRKKGERVKAVIIGDGILKSKLDELIKRFNLEDSIDMIGFQSNPYKYLKLAKILVMPSTFEGFGLAALEGMALGLPVLCSGAGGLKNIVSNSTGKICSSLDQYIEEIEKLLSDHSYYDEKSNRSIKQVKIFSNKEKYTDQIEKIYQSLGFSE